MQKILALVIVILGLGGGLGLGLVLQPKGGGHATEAAAAGGPGGDHGKASSAQGGGQGGPAQSSAGSHGGGHTAAEDAGGGHDGEAGADRDYVKIGRQLIIPVVDQGETRALMLFDIALDVPRALTERAYSAEPLLRDAFLRELFELSYTGAFSSTYTDERIVDELRGKLRAAARRLLGDGVSAVLILDIMRQEL